MSTKNTSLTSTKRTLAKMELELTRLRLAWVARPRDRFAIEAYAAHIKLSMKLLKLTQNENLEREGVK